MEDSLKKRYFFKLLTNLIGLAVSGVTQAIIPRGLGPKAYGDFTFLTNFFTQLVGFLDMGTSIAFYTKLSQRSREAAMVSFYLYFSGIISVAIIIFLVITTHKAYTYRWIWPDQKIFYIYLGAVWGIFTWFLQVLIMMMDAYAVTVSSEIARTLQKLLGLALIILLFSSQQLNLTSLFFYHYLILAFLAAALIWIMGQKGYSLKQTRILPWDQIKVYIKEFYPFCQPLFIYALVGLLVNIFDRWLLQFYGGSIEQGFYGLSYQIGAICFLFTSAMTPLITRELAIAFDKEDLGRMAHLFRRYIPLLYGIAAYFSCFIAVQAHKVIYIMGGKHFSGAYLAVAIMALYPLHQTYGQLSGSVFFATGQTALYRNIGIVFMLLGIPVTYFLIAPGDKSGLDAGATGLAVKMVMLQFIVVNVQLYFNARLLRLRFWRYVGHQVVSVGCLLAVALLVTLWVDKMMLPSRDKVVSGFLLAGALYTIMVMVMSYFQPALFGLHRQDMQSLAQLVREKCRLK